MKKKRIGSREGMIVALGVLLCLSFGAIGVLSGRNRTLESRLSMERQRDMTDVVSAMADIEVNLQKLLIASGASQSASLLGETALLAQHVENGLSRLPLSVETAADAMKFAGQMGDYVMTLAAQVSGGEMISTGDEEQIEGLLAACQGLNAHLMQVGGQLYSERMQEAAIYDGAGGGWQEKAIGGDIEYPSLIYDGPFSDGRTGGPPKGLTGGRVTREQARERAARFAGVSLDRVRDAADSGGPFEAFGFSAQTKDGNVSVQITGQGGHLLWMMPEQAEFEERIPKETCLEAAQKWLDDHGFDPMERCFVQQYDGMVVANFAAMQDEVLLYPDQVKVQVSMQTGNVVGAECSQYWMNHVRREALESAITREMAEQALSSRLEVKGARLCVIPTDAGETLCWEFDGEFSGGQYYAYVDAKTGEAREILRVTQTMDGETAI